MSRKSSDFNATRRLDTGRSCQTRFRSMRSAGVRKRPEPLARRQSLAALSTRDAQGSEHDPARIQSHPFFVNILTHQRIEPALPFYKLRETTSRPKP